MRRNGQVTNPSSNLITVKDVTKHYGKKIVLEDINLGIDQGDIFGIIGMSGAGKTTLFSTILGFSLPDKGDVLFKPEHLLELNDSTVYKSVYKERNEVKKTFGFATQTPSFYDTLTVKENLIYFGNLYKLPKDILDTNITMALSLVGLESELQTLAKDLSGGMQKRLDIACSLIHSPSVLLLDEPTADLDPVLRRQMWQLIKKINAKGTTILLASHFLDEIEHLCTKIAILHKHKITAYGSITELKNKYSNNEEFHIETSPGNYTKIVAGLKRSLPKKATFTQKDNKLIVGVENAEKNLPKVMSVLRAKKEKIVQLDMSHATLIEIFEQITNEDLE